ncbi:MAG: endonuclease/exonuclease/phosphatase family protein [Hyphomicrobiales bacterium]|nr:endonuclease/exonuclease/phosphatase family protein [Hyphomicrobiales bacterium]
MTFAIASFNAENLGFSRDFDQRLGALRPVLHALRADVLCLQEVNAPRETPQGPRGFAPLDELVRGTPYATFHRATSARPGSSEPADVHNLAVLSRFPIEETRQLHHDLVPAWDWTPPGEDAPVRAQFDRPILYVRARMAAGPLHVLNLHLRAPRAAHLPGDKQDGRWTSSAGWAKGMFLAAQLRQAQALEARLFAEGLFDAEPDARIVVCGDFNADSYETPTRILCGAADDLDSAAFAERRLERLEARVEPGRRHTVIHAGRRVLLDHILASPALARDCAGVEILNENLIDEATAPDEVIGSLHAPVVARFA